MPADDNEASRLLGEWRQNVMNSLSGIHTKLDGFDGRLRLVEVGVIQREQIERLEREYVELKKDCSTRLGKLEGYKQRLIGYALGAGCVAGAIFELVRWLWPR